MVITRLRSAEGSFTVEAAMVLPIIMCVTMLLLFFCLYSYQKSMLLQVAFSSTEQAAYNWDNSHKGRDGSVSPGQYDSLYWRIGDDRLLGSLFGTGENSEATLIHLPVGDTQGNSLPAVKLGSAAAGIPDNMPGEMSYRHTLTGRKIKAKLRRMLNLPVLDGMLSDGAQPEVSTQALVAEPVEFIRTVDLMRYYGAKFRSESAQDGPDNAMKQRDASAMVSKLGKR